MEEGQAPTKPRFNINIPLGSGKRAEQEDGLQNRQLLMPSAKREELGLLRQAQEDTEKGRAAMREKLELERAEQKRQGTAARRKQIAAERRSWSSRWKATASGIRRKNRWTSRNHSFPLRIWDDLINRVAPAAGSGYAREDQAVLHT